MSGQTTNCPGIPDCSIPMRAASPFKMCNIVRSRAVLIVAMLFAGCSRGPARAATQPSNTPQNVLLITIDTLRADHVGAYGDAAAHTPTLDGLARDGVRFD